LVFFASVYILALTQIPLWDAHQHSGSLTMVGALAGRRGIVL
jgi:hypothetical protein